MTEIATAQMSPYLVSLEQVVADVVAPAAVEIDQAAAFPRAALRISNTSSPPHAHAPENVPLS